MVKISSNLPVLDGQILDSAVTGNGAMVNQIETIKGNKYALAAKTITDNADQTVGVLIHGSLVELINSGWKNSLLAQSVLSLIILILLIYLSQILNDAITNQTLSF